jgi:hypothetical protein
MVASTGGFGETRILGHDVAIADLHAKMARAVTAMGFGSIISGYINISGDVRAAVARLEAMPSCADRTSSLWPREAFGLTTAKALIDGRAVGQIAYKDECLIPVGMSVKEADGDWEQWLIEFEGIFQSLDTIEAFIVLRLTNGIASTEFDGRCFYLWTLDFPYASRNWTFIGGPRSFT